MIFVAAVEKAGASGFVRRKPLPPDAHPIARQLHGATEWMPVMGLGRGGAGGGYMLHAEDALADDWEIKLPETSITRSHLENAIQSIASEWQGQEMRWPELVRLLAMELGV